MNKDQAAILAEEESGKRLFTEWYAILTGGAYSQGAAASAAMYMVKVMLAIPLAENIADQNKVKTDALISAYRAFGNSLAGEITEFAQGLAPQVVTKQQIENN